MKLDKCIGINLTSLSDEKITIKRIEQFIAIVFEFLDRHNVQPTYWGVDGKGFSSKLQKFTPRKLSNLKEKKGYLDKDGKIIEGLSFEINPEGSDSPAYDSYLYVDISYSELSKKLEFSLTVDPQKIPLSSWEIGWFIKRVVELFTPDFGFVYLHEEFEHVNAEVLVYDDGKYSGRKKKLEDWWYALPKEEKKQTLRDIYPVNILRKTLFQETIEKLLKGDKTLFSFYKYHGSSWIKSPFVEVKLPNDEVTCIVSKEYIEMCEE